MKTYYLVIALLYVAAALDPDTNGKEKQQCQCDEGSKVSLQVSKNSNSECGQLTLNGCSLIITCHSNFSLKLDTDANVDLVCSNNNTAILQTSDKRSVHIILECSQNTAANLEESSQISVLRISQVCSSYTNATSNTTTRTVTTGAGVQTTQNNNNSTNPSNSSTVIPSSSSTVIPSNSSTAIPSNNSTAIPSNNSTVTPDHSNYSNTTWASNSSDTSTGGAPSGSSTLVPTTTTQHAVSFRVCSGLLVMMLVVSSLL